MNEMLNAHRTTVQCGAELMRKIDIPHARPILYLYRALKHTTLLSATPIGNQRRGLQNGRPHLPFAYCFKKQHESLLSHSCLIHAERRMRAEHARCAHAA